MPKEPETLRTPDRQPYLLPLFYAIASLVLARIGAGIRVPPSVAVLSLALAMFPNLLLVIPKPKFVAALIVVLAIVLAFEAPGVAQTLTFSFSAIACLATVYLTAHALRLKFETWFDLLLKAGCGLICAAFLLKHQIFPFVAPDDLLNGWISFGLSTDLLFHLALSNTIYFQHWPSTGLHGVPYLPYHYLGHIFVAIAKGMTGLKIHEVFPYFVALLVYPWLFLVIECLMRHLRAPRFWPLALCAVWFGASFREPLPWFTTHDPTMPIGLVIAGSVLLWILRSPHSNAPLFLLPFAFMSKLSVGLFALLTLGVRILSIPMSLVRRIGLLFAVMVLGVTLYFSFFSVGGQPSGRTAFNLLSIFKRNYSHLPLPVFLWEHFYAPLLVGAILLLDRKRRFGILERISAETIAIATVLALFFMNITHPGGSQIYFLILANWVALPIAVLLLTEWACSHSSIHKKIFGVAWVGAGLLVTGSHLFALPGDYSRFTSERQSRITAIASDAGVEMKELETRRQRLLPFLSALQGLSLLDPSRQSLVEIPESETHFWEHSPFQGSRAWMAFLIPALSDRPAYRGFNAELMLNQPIGWYPPGYYGYFVYNARPDRDPCGDSRFSSILSLSSQSDGSVVHDRRPCRRN